MKILEPHQPKKMLGFIRMVPQERGNWYLRRDAEDVIYELAKQLTLYKHQLWAYQVKAPVEKMSKAMMEDEIRINTALAMQAVSDKREP